MILAHVNLCYGIFIVYAATKKENVYIFNLFRISVRLVN